MYLLIPRAALRFVSQQKEKGCQIIRQYWKVDKSSNRRWCCSSVTVNTNNRTPSTGDLPTRGIMTSHDKKPFQRLPKTISPYHYEITLSPDLKNFVFQGSENIYIDVKESTKTVILNSLDIEIKNAVFHNNDGSELSAEKIDVSNSEETATFIFPKELPLGKTGHLSIVFQGEINDKMKGLYRSKYNRPDGSIAHAAVTQFEPTDARRCFPCWDEPAHKSKFDITLTVPSSLTVLSNMPVKTRTKEDDSTEVLTFETTPVMSTYLVAVVVGEFDYVEGTSSDGVLVRVYTPKSKSEQGLFALEVATKVLPYYKEYFGIAYPLPKIDLIAIPDFSSGAMENWGLVTYRETCLLVDPQNTSSVRKQWIALVVAHELAHQWFGNLVTMEWWTHLWLNEGYASFVEFLCVAHLFPEYDIWTQFVTDTHIRALELDGLKHSHPIEVPVGHPSEIDEIFDEISYNKGACVIRMLHSYISDDDFRKGMNLYLNRYSYSNAETENLWAALEEASKKSVRSVMSAWTKKQGFPVIKVEQRQEGKDRVLSLSQERFLADGSTHEKDDVCWIIPVSISTAKDPKEIAVNTIMDSKTAEIRIKDLPANQWAKLNPGTIGFYRTRYNPEALSLLLPAIKDNSLPPLDRLGLLDDLFAMVQAGHASTNQVLELIQAFQHEENYTVWSSIVNCLSKISVLISHLEEHSNFKAYSRNLMTDICKKLGWEPKPNESHLDTLLRPLVLGRMAAMEDQETIRECQRRFELHVSGEQILAADLRSPVYRGVLATGDSQIFETMLKLYKEADLHEEKDRIMRVLGTVKNESLLPKVLEFSLSEHVRAQDTIFTIIPVTSTYKGRLLTWQFFKDNRKTLVDRYGGTFLITRLTKHITENFVTEEQAKEVEAFFETYPIAGTERCMQQSVETIRLNAAWLKRDEEDIKDFLIRSTTA